MGWWISMGFLHSRMWGGYPVHHMSLPKEKAVSQLFWVLFLGLLNGYLRYSEGLATWRIIPVTYMNMIACFCLDAPMISCSWKAFFYTAEHDQCGSWFWIRHFHIFHGVVLAKFWTPSPTFGNLVLHATLSSLLWYPQETLDFTGLRVPRLYGKSASQWSFLLNIDIELLKNKCIVLYILFINWLLKFHWKIWSFESSGAFLTAEI